eukprot:9190049-Karenia_brevis.AAC.1
MPSSTRCTATGIIAGCDHGHAELCDADLETKAFRLFTGKRSFTIEIAQCRMPRSTQAVNKDREPDALGTKCAGCTRPAIKYWLSYSTLEIAT